MPVWRFRRRANKTSCSISELFRFDYGGEDRGFIAQMRMFRTSGGDAVFMTSAAKGAPCLPCPGSFKTHRLPGETRPERAIGARCRPAWIQLIIALHPLGPSPTLGRFFFGVGGICRIARGCGARLATSSADCRAGNTESSGKNNQNAEGNCPRESVVDRPLGHA